MDAAMLVLHAQLMDGSGHVHHAAGPDPLMWLGMGLVTAQFALADAAALRRP